MESTWLLSNIPGAEAHRNPILLFVFVGLLLLRLAARTLFQLLFQLPPRSTFVACPHAAVASAKQT